MARVGRWGGTRVGSNESTGGDGDDAVDRAAPQPAVRAVAWAGAGGTALAAALAVVALGGGEPEGPWSLAVTVLAVAATSLMAVSLYITVEAADAADAADARPEPGESTRTDEASGRRATP